MSNFDTPVLRMELDDMQFSREMQSYIRNWLMSGRHRKPVIVIMEKEYAPGASSLNAVLLRKRWTMEMYFLKSD